MRTFRPSLVLAGALQYGRDFFLGDLARIDEGRRLFQRVFGEPLETVTENHFGSSELDTSAASLCTDYRFKRSSKTQDLNQHMKMLSDWEQYYDQISRGRFEGNVTKAWDGGIQIFEERMSQAVFQTVIGCADTVSFGVFLLCPKGLAGKKRCLIHGT